jgi:multidrug efflux pump subunit AcrA (membrane-fusion protein)
MSQTIVPETQSDSPPVPEPKQPDASQKESKAPPRESRAAGLGVWLWKTLPTLAVMAVLAGLGYAGHHTGWKLPKFSELNGSAASVPDDWCTEHGVPELFCVACNPDEFPKPKDFGWCKIHGVHQCPLHHPEVAQLKTVPQITPADLERADLALKLRPRAENNFACQNPGRRIQFASQESAAKAGVVVELVERAAIVESISAAGEIRYDETRLARLSSKSAGSVWRVDKQVGDRVKQGEILALIDAAEVGRVKSKLLTALAQKKLQQQIQISLKGLAKQGIVPERKLQEAETALTQARTEVLSAQQALINLGLPISVDRLAGLSERQLAKRIQFLGLSRNLTDQFDPATTTSNLLPVTAPLDGIVATRNVVVGEVVDPAKVLFELVDTRQMWLVLNVPLEEAKYVHTGQKVEFLPDDAGREVTGRIVWMSTTADPQTRTVQVRADLPNLDNGLRNETFGLGRIVLREEREAIVVPNSSVMWDGSCRVVFVRDKAWFEQGVPKIFHTRSVRAGVKNREFTEIIAGVLPGEVVATTGSDVLRAQLLKNNLGAG